MKYLLCLLLAGCSVTPIDMSEYTITYRASADVPDRHNGASLERWADHPTYILFHKDGAVIRMPDGVKGGQ